MSDATFFETAVAVVLEHEGFDRFTNDPADPGGATKWGISLRLLRRLTDGDIDGDGDIDADDVRRLTRERATDIYRVEFWDRHGYDRIFDPRVATKVFDLAVNMGPRQAHRCLQRALRACGRRVVEDGVLGPVTRAAMNAEIDGRLIVALRAEAAGFYRVLAADPARRRYLEGWLNRAYD